MIDDEFEEYEDLLSKPNRRKTRERETVVKDGMPPSGIHEESRKQRDKRRNARIRRAKERG